MGKPHSCFTVKILCEVGAHTIPIATKEGTGTSALGQISSTAQGMLVNLIIVFRRKICSRKHFKDLKKLNDKNTLDNVNHSQSLFQFLSACYCLPQYSPISSAFSEHMYSVWKRSELSYLVK